MGGARLAARQSAIPLCWPKDFPLWALQPGAPVTPAAAPAAPRPFTRWLARSAPARCSHRLPATATPPDPRTPLPDTLLPPLIMYCCALWAQAAVSAASSVTSTGVAQFMARMQSSLQGHTISANTIATTLKRPQVGRGGVGALGSGVPFGGAWCGCLHVRTPVVWRSPGRGQRCWLAPAAPALPRRPRGPDPGGQQQQAVAAPHVINSTAWRPDLSRPDPTSSQVEAMSAHRTLPPHLHRAPVSSCAGADRRDGRRRVHCGRCWAAGRVHHHRAGGPAPAVLHRRRR